MTQDGVRNGGSPRSPKPGDSTDPNGAAPIAPTPAAAQPMASSPADWLAAKPGTAPVAPVVPVVAPAPVAAPAARVPAPAVGRWVAPTPAPVAPPAVVDDLDDADLDADLDSDDYADADAEPAEMPKPKVPLADRLKRTPPALVILTLAAIASTGFLLFEMSTRTAPIAVLTSAAVVMGFVYVMVAAVCSIATYRSATDGLTGRSFLLAFIGGMSAIVAAGSFAGALILFLALGF
jgi:hypothetical protein